MGRADELTRLEVRSGWRKTYKKGGVGCFLREMPPMSLMGLVLRVGYPGVFCALLCTFVHDFPLPHGLNGQVPGRMMKQTPIGDGGQKRMERTVYFYCALLGVNCTQMGNGKMRWVQAALLGLA